MLEIRAGYVFKIWTTDASLIGFLPIRSLTKQSLTKDG